VDRRGQTAELEISKLLRWRFIENERIGDPALEENQEDEDVTHGSASPHVVGAHDCFECG
jgi:hypothetical protein